MMVEILAGIIIFGIAVICVIYLAIAICAGVGIVIQGICDFLALPWTVYRARQEKQERLERIQANVEKHRGHNPETCIDCYLVAHGWEWGENNPVVRTN